MIAVEIVLRLVGAVPNYVWAALVAMLAATSCTLKLENGSLTLEVVKYETRIAELQNGIEAANANAAATTARFTEQARKAEQARATREAALRADAASARIELDRLRVAVASPYGLRPAGNPIGAGLVYSNPVDDLFVQCSERLVDLAAKADGHASDVRALVDAWPKPEEKPSSP